MAGRQAKILHEQQINDLLVFASATRNPLRNKLMVLLSIKAGLRAGEIAGLTWDMVLDPTGEVSQAIELHDCIAKKHSGRRIPIHPELQIALTAWRLLTGGSWRALGRTAAASSHHRRRGLHHAEPTGPACGTYCVCDSQGKLLENRNGLGKRPHSRARRSSA
jgi:integrase